MPRAPGVQLRRRPRSDGSITYSLRVRISGADEAIPLGNTGDGWDEARAEKARQQTLAKIELGLWKPQQLAPATTSEREPTFAALATEWLADRERNPGIRPRTTEDDRWRLERYLIPFFGALLPSQITPTTIKEYRRSIHDENAHIRAGGSTGGPPTDPHSGKPLRTLSNDSINKTLRTLALILDEAEDAGWITRNVARGRRMREPVQRHKGDVLEADEFLDMLEAARQLDHDQHKPETLIRAERVRAMRDQTGMQWKDIGRHIGVAPTTAIYLYGCQDTDVTATGPRRAVIATLGLAGPRVSELCALDIQHVDLIKAKLHVRDAKTAAGIRTIDIRPGLLEELCDYLRSHPEQRMDRPAFPTRTGQRRDRNNINSRIIGPILHQANALRAERGRSPVLAHVTPHTFRRTYITFMLAAGFDLPYVQDQVGHKDPTTTLAIYAQVIRRLDRDQLRAEMRALLGEDRLASDTQRPMIAAVNLNG